MMKLYKKIGILVLSLIMVASMFGMTALADYRTVERGDEDNDVKTLQTRLQELGYYDYHEVTGYFGIITEDALKDFQRDLGLKVDGVAGPETWAAVMGAEINTTGNSTRSITESSDVTYSKGMEGDEIEQIQRRLQELGLYNYDRITGYFGSLTKDAIKSFQSAYSLDVDGVVGIQTWNRLFSEYKETSLIPGMKSDDVRELQERLKELGYYTYSVDGSYGKKTTEAVRYFQKANNLTADGIAGLKTKQVLFSTAAVKEQDARRDVTSSSSSSSSDKASGTAAEIIDFARQYLGRPYVYGANGPDSFDCTGFTTYVFKHFGISLPRTAYNQGYNDYGIKITDRNNLKPGDLVFFNSNRNDGDLSDHAGIYIGNGDFIHCTSGKADSVTITSLTDGSTFHTRAFVWGRRVLND